MNTVVYVFALIVYLVIEVECQGARGFRFIAEGLHLLGKVDVDCKHDNCSSHSPIFDAFMIGLVKFLICFFGGATLCIFLCGIFLWIKECITRPSRSNTIFIKQETIEICESEKSDVIVFKSGYWKSQYYQYGSWHGPHQYALSFDSQSMQVTGTGSDDVGTFTINGIYSNETNRLGVIKIYQTGTGNFQENIGHQVTIQLTWNTQSNKFEGEWCVQTIQYHAKNVFELTYSERQQFSIEER